MSRIVSSLPGRIRVRDSALRNQARIELIEANLIRIEDILAIDSNIKAGSIVLHFDGAKTDSTALEAKIEQAVDQALSAPLPSSRRPRSVKMQVNRYAKIGMLGSLTTSLALAATGQKRWHAVTGGIFVTCLGVHLTTHRRSILR